MRGSRPHNPQNPFVVVDDIYFYKESSSGYYLGNVRIPGRKRRYPMRLHVYIWQKYNGEVPDGYHVHHSDENKDNNDISNLTLMRNFDHLSLHGHSRSEDSSRNMIENVIPKAAEWHKSDAAKPWHKEHYQKVTKDIWMKPTEMKCDYCGATFTVTHSASTHSRFCSNKCKSAFRRASGVDDIKKVCIKCGKTFVANKYQKVKYCSECRPLSARRPR